MSDLDDFFLARIAEDEAAARAATPGPWEVQNGAPSLVYGDPPHGVFVCNTGVGGRQVHDDATHIARWDPARVLAECDAKRRMLEALRYLAELPEGMTMPDRESAMLLDVAVGAMAAVYADHPDFREEWRP